jgi:mono/diheme cytochrome c family protein
MKRTFLLGCMALSFVALVVAQTNTPVPKQQPAQNSTSKSSAPVSSPGANRSAPATAAATPAPTTASVAAQRALLDQYCVTCHSDKTKRANLTLEKLDLATAGDHPELWEKVIRKLRAGVMPPPGMRRPTLTEYEGLRDWLEAEMDRKAAMRGVNPGYVVLHRLNRTEYANVIHELLDIEIDPAKFLPPDDSARGFDNVAGSLTISPTLLEAYTTAAARISRMAVGYWKAPTEASYIAPGDVGQTHHIEGLPLGTRGGMLVHHNFPSDGEYKFSIQNFGVGTYVPGEQIEFLVDGERVKLVDYVGVGLSQGMQGENDGSIDVTVPVKAGSHVVGATFLETNYRPSLNIVKEYERKSLDNNSIAQLQYYPVIGFFRITGPFLPQRPEDSRSMRKVLTCRPANASQEQPCAKQILSTLTRRAYRRPVGDQDLESLMSFYEEGRKLGTFDDGIEVALRRLLASPEFLIRVEKEPGNVEPGKPYHISDLELASRLSFFLWSSVPDEQLINLAAQGKLHTPAVLEQQTRRMLADPRSKALVENFADQVLYLRNLPVTSPDGKFYPNWDDELRKDFRTETEMLFESIMREDRNIVDLLTANYTFLNERLAKHYGIPGINGGQFRRVSLGPDLDYRRGLLGQGSFLSITWVQNFRTSPVKRGVWVLENILGTAAPEPPPNVPPLEDATAGSTKVLTLREQMTLHRKNEPCASCHKLMDNIGFPLENFDADATWRTKQGGEGGTVIDPSAELWDGTKVKGPVELRQALLHYSPAFVRSITEKMMTYALGRGVEYFDMPVVRSIVRDADKNQDRFSTIVLGIVKSAPFQMRTKVGESAN